MLKLAIDITLPLTDPVLKFLIILLIILLIPILSDRIRIPHLLGMILAGVIIGPHGFNLMTRDSSIILSGTAGLIYIMFLSGLEIDMEDFRRNAGRSTLLGLYGFVIPMILGTVAGMYLLHFSPVTSVLLASMFASHTLITYPIVSKFGIFRNRAVNIAVGSTLITNVLALTVLAIIVALTGGELNTIFWIKLVISYLAFSAVIIFLFPIVARWFLKRYSDNISQYIFVLVLVFLGGVMSKFAGIEAIIGAFLAGLSLNRLIPRTSPLMNRIDFVGNAIFIPFFLIGVGMLIDFRAFVNRETIWVALVMTSVALAGKFIPAWLAQKSFGYTQDERKIIFGLTNSQAAATLAAVLIGYNIILSYGPGGEPIRLLNDSVLNGTIVMILVTCTVSSFVTQRGAQKIALSDITPDEHHENMERILLPVSNPENIEELISLSTIIKSKRNTDGLFALNILTSDSADPEAEKSGKKLLEKSVIAASATDVRVRTILRYDRNLVSGISNVVKENGISDLMLGLHVRKSMSDSFFGRLTLGLLSRCNCTTYIYRPVQPISTIKRHNVVIPPRAEDEPGFSFWLSKIWNIAQNTGAKIIFYTAEETKSLLEQILVNHPINAELNLFEDWSRLSELRTEVKADDNLIIVLSRRNFVSYQPAMESIPVQLNDQFRENSFLIIYPSQSIAWNEEQLDLTSPSLLEAIEKVDFIGKTVASIFRRK
jgi:Kef-type K+ transport system membrane component KefB